MILAVTDEVNGVPSSCVSVTLSEIYTQRFPELLIVCREHLQLMNMAT